MYIFVRQYSSFFAKKKKIKKFYFLFFCGIICFTSCAVAQKNLCILCIVFYKKFIYIKITDFNESLCI